MDERELLFAYKTAKEQREIAKESLKALQERYDKAEMALLEFLTDKGAESTAKYDGIGYASIAKPRVFASCLKENEDKLKAYLIKHKRADLIKEVVLPQSLSGYVGELISEGKEVPALVNYYLKTSIKIY